MIIWNVNSWNILFWFDVDRIRDYDFVVVIKCFVNYSDV